jgi:uncharacterized protein YjbI with pentapeptide repeats
MKRTAKTFDEYIKDQKFTHPKTKNQVGFSSLPAEKQKKIRADFKKSSRPKGNQEDIARALKGDKNLRGADLRGMEFDDYFDFKGANLRGAKLQGVKLHNADLEGADLTGADLTEAKLYLAYFENATLNDATLNKAYLEKADFRGAKLNNTKLKEANLKKADLRRAELKKADLSEANLHTANLRRADLTEAELKEADLTDGYFDYVIFLDANLQDAKGIPLDVSDEVKHKGLTKAEQKRKSRKASQMLNRLNHEIRALKRDLDK